MRKFRFQAFQEQFRKTFPVNLIVAAAIVCGGIQSGLNASGDWADAGILILLAVVAGFYAVRDCDCSRPGGWSAQVCAWAFLGVAAFSVWSPYTAGISSDYLVLLVAVAACCYRGWSPMLRLLPILFLALWLLPRQEPLFLALSYPLRLLSTYLSVGALELIGVALHHEGTTITIGGSDIAITDACSGISQLAVLAFLGYLMVRRIPAAPGWRILYYLCLLPIVVIANSIRIMLVVLLYMGIGERSFSDPYHSGLGYLLVVMTVVMFWGLGRLIPHREATPAPEVNHE